MAKKLENKYFITNEQGGTFTDVTTAFDGVNILSVSGMSSLGKAVNVYKEQWVDSDVEDFMIVGNSIVRENVNTVITFAVSRRYATTQIDEEAVYDSFVDYMTNKDVWVASAYIGKKVHCVCVDKCEPKKVKLKRGGNSYIIGEITLDNLEKPSNFTR